MCYHTVQWSYLNIKIKDKRLIFKFYAICDKQYSVYLIVFKYFLGAKKELINCNAFILKN